MQYDMDTATSTTSWHTHYFESAQHTSSNNNNSNGNPRIPFTFARQNAFINDSADELEFPFHADDSSPDEVSSHSSSLSLSSSSSSSLSDTVTERRQSYQHRRLSKKRFSRSPRPTNTADYDAPMLETPNSSETKCDKVSGSLLSESLSVDRTQRILRITLIFTLSCWAYQLFSCTELQSMPTERLYAIDPDAPNYVWIPVIQWTCWRRTWIGNYSKLALWLTGAIIVLYWVHGKRR